MNTSFGGGAGPPNILECAWVANGILFWWGDEITRGGKAHSMCPSQHSRVSPSARVMGFSLFSLIHGVVEVTSDINRHVGLLKRGAGRDYEDVIFERPASVGHDRIGRPWEKVVVSTPQVPIDIHIRSACHQHTPRDTPSHLHCKVTLILFHCSVVGHLEVHVVVVEIA